jgi:hypothetical protein
VSHFRLAIIFGVIALVLTVLDGLWYAFCESIAWWHGIYCIWMTDITVGGDVSPTHWGHLCLALAPVILAGAVIGFFTSALSELNVKKAEDRIKDHTERHIVDAETRIKDHTERRIKHHLGIETDTAGD